MIYPIVHASEPVALIGGADVNDEVLAQVLSLAPQVVAADGGADAALARGIEPLAVIGDLDSLSPLARETLPPARLHRIAEQDSTDFDKCLRSIQAPLVLGAGFSGRRLDHELAAFNTLVRRPDRRCVLVGEETLVFLAPPVLRLDVPAKTLVSLFPMGLVEGQSDGLHWPIRGLTFTPDGRIGTSNLALGELSLSFTAPKMLLILPRWCLGQVVADLLRAPARWPAP